MDTSEFMHNLAINGISKRPRAHPKYYALLWFISALAYFSAIIWYIGLRADLSTMLTQPAFLLEILFATTIALGAAFSASWLALPDVNQQAKIRWLPFIPLLLLSLLLGYQLMAQHSYTIDAGYECFFHMVIFIIIPTALLFYCIAKGAPTHYAWSGVTTGLLVNGLSYGTLRIFESNDNVVHIVIWHYLPMFLTTAVLIGLAQLYFNRSNLTGKSVSHLHE